MKDFRKEISDVCNAVRQLSLLAMMKTFPPEALERGNTSVDESQIYFSDSKWWSRFSDLLTVSTVIFWGGIWMVFFFLRSARLFVEQQYKGQLGVWSTKSAFQVTVSEAVTAFSLDCR